MPDLLFTTSDDRWRVYRTTAGNGWTLVEKHPGGGVTDRLVNVSLAEIGEFLAACGVGPEEQRPA